MNAETFVAMGWRLLLSLMLCLPADAYAQKRQRDLLTAEEIMTSGKRFFDLYDVVKDLRPRFLQAPPGARSFGNSRAATTPIAVYVDGKRDSGLDALKSIDPQQVHDVRYLDPQRADNEIGPSAAGGAILVRLRGAQAKRP